MNDKDWNKICDELDKITEIVRGIKETSISMAQFASNLEKATKTKTRTIYGKEYTFELQKDGKYWMTTDLTNTKQGIHQGKGTEYFTFDQANNLKLPKDVKIPSKDDFVKLYESYDRDAKRFLKGSVFADSFSGLCSYSDGLYGQGNYGRYWSSTAYGADGAFGLYFGDEYVYPGSVGNEGVGYAVRCVIEGGK